MKKQLPAFAAGVLTATLIGTLVVPTLANTITSRTTIEVDPINIMVNGEVFQPTDVNGDPVAVFLYQGTTYAPLRALAEAYGLNVGYDAERNMATVGEVENKSVENVVGEKDEDYEAFKAMWKSFKYDDMSIFRDPMNRCGFDVHPYETNMYHMTLIDTSAIPKSTVDKRYSVQRDYLSNNFPQIISKYAHRLCSELQEPGKNTYIIFMANEYTIYSAMQLKDGSFATESGY